MRVVEAFMTINIDIYDMEKY